MALVVSTLLFAGPVAVQNANAQIELSFGAGMNSPLGDYGDQANKGYALNAGLGYRILPLAVLGVEASYNGNKASDEVLEGLGDGYEMSSSILQYSALAKLVLPVGDHSVFAKGSVGFYRASAKVSGPLGDGSFNTTEPGYGIGGGFIINGSKSSSFFADATYHRVAFDDGDTNYITIMAGALIKFDLGKSSLRDDLQDDIDKLKD
jgi:hypothetical protein